MGVGTRRGAHGRDACALNAKTVLQCKIWKIMRARGDCQGRPPLHAHASAALIATHCDTLRHVAADKINSHFEIGMLFSRFRESRRLAPPLKSPAAREKLLPAVASKLLSHHVF
jgi:hypothetical protein